MSDISQVTIGGTTYDIKDATARTDKDKVAQYNANVATDNSYYPVVFSYSTSSSDVTTYLKKTNSIYYNPYAKDLRVSGTNSTTGKSHATSVYYDRLKVYDQYFEDPMDVSSLVEECIEITPTDIAFTEGDTWDGTNSSLKTAVTALKSNLIKLDKFTVSCPHTTSGSNYYYGRTSIATQLAEYTNIIAVIPIFNSRGPGIDAVHSVNYNAYTLTDGYFTGGNLEVSSNRTGTSTVMVYVLHL